MRVGLQSVHRISSQTFLPPHVCPCYSVSPADRLQSFRINLLLRGSSMGHDSFRTCPHIQCGVLHRLQWGYLLQYGLFCGLQGNTCFSLVSSIDVLAPGQPPPQSSLTLIFTGFFLILFPHSWYCCATFFTLSYIRFPRSATSLADVLSCVPQGVHWSQLDPSLSDTEQPLTSF